jgi:hypothetical protein
MARGQRHRQIELRSGPVDHAAFVAALPQAEPAHDALSLADLVADDIRAANRAGNFTVAASLEVIAVRLGALKQAIPAALDAASPQTAAALSDLAALL